MSVRLGLLATLADGPQHAYELRRRFEERTQGAWPLNQGQVSATLTSLQRAGHITTDGATPDGATRYVITDDGRAALHHWWATLPDRGVAERDELTMKIVLALSQRDIHADAVIAEQRDAILRSMQDLNRTRRQSRGAPDTAWDLIVDRALLIARAELDWLNQVAQRAPTITSPTASADQEHTHAR